MFHAPPIAALKAFEQVNIGIVLSLFLLCILIWIIGAFKERSIPAAEGSTARAKFPSLPDYAIVFLLLSILIGNSIAVIYQPNAPDGNPWMNALFYSLLFLPVLLRIFFLPKPNRVTLSFKNTLKLITLGIVSTWIISAIVSQMGLYNFFVDTLGSPEEQDVITTLTDADWNQKLSLVFSAIILAPIMEECLFRGLLYPCLRRFIKPTFSMILCGLLFGAVHMALPQLIPLSALGCYLCYLYEKAQSLWLPILTHMIFNSITVTILLLVLPLLEHLGYELQDKI